MASDSINPPSALLLLPSPASFDYIKIKDAFEPSVSDVMIKLSGSVKGSHRIASVDIALGVSALLSRSNKPVSRIFKGLQHYLASIYTLIGAVAAAQDIELDSPGGIDARVVFIDYSPPGHPSNTSAQTRPRSQFGPLLDILSLATSGRRWDHVFYPNDEAGKTLANCFANCVGHNSTLKDSFAAVIQPVSSSPDWTVSDSALQPEVESNNAVAGTSAPKNQLLSTPHYIVAVGGTFDHLHLGHKLLLTATALALEPMEQPDDPRQRCMYIGITGDALLVNKKYAEYLESWEQRYQSTAAFLSAIMNFSADNAPQIDRVSEKSIVMRILPRLELKLVEITDPFGPTITEEDITALVVSAETHAGGAAVNDKREEKGWEKLAVFEVDVLQSDASIDSKISSTDIRRRRMNLAKV